MSTRKNRDADEFKFTNQNWKRVLSEITDYAPHTYGRCEKGKSNPGEDHPLCKRLRIKPDELMLIMSFLDEQGLTERDKSDLNMINLTSKGFDVALQNQSAKKVEIFNKATLFLSLTIAVSAIAELLTGILDLYQKWLILVLIVAALVWGGLIIKNRF